MTYHEPVLLQESIDGLNIRPGGIYVDATFGGGGHSNEILKHIEKGRLIAFDQDSEALENAINDDRFLLVHANFRYLKNFLKYLNVQAIDGVIADLGISSHQIDDQKRGFSIRGNAEIDLRMNTQGNLNAKTIFENYSEEELSRLFYEYSDMRDSRKIAKAIVQFRAKKKIKTMEDIQEAIGAFAERGRENKFYAKILQAMRIEINQELESLRDLLLHTAEKLVKGGRLVVISYHSLEDRMVKNFMRSGNFSGEETKDFYGNKQSFFKLITRKPIAPGEKEIELNSRARSAKLRIAEKN